MARKPSGQGHIGGKDQKPMRELDTRISGERIFQTEGTRMVKPKVGCACCSGPVWPQGQGARRGLVGSLKEGLGQSVIHVSFCIPHSLNPFSPLEGLRRSVTRESESNSAQKEKKGSHWQKMGMEFLDFCALSQLLNGSG